MNYVYFLFISAFALQAQAVQSSAELTCRSQAKEIAVQTYSNCITQARNNQIDDIRKSYKEELAALKSKYDQELKKMGGNSAATGKKAKKKASVAKEISAQRPVKGIARKLPVKHGGHEALPLQNENDGDKVVSLNADATDAPESALEKEAAQADSIEVIEMPVDDAPST